MQLLSALGIELGPKLSAPRLKVYAANKSDNQQILLFRGNLFGVPWPVIANQLEDQNISYDLVDAGQIWLSVTDNSKTRGLLQEIPISYKTALKTQIHVPNEGFRKTEIQKKFEITKLLPPGVILVATVVAGLFLIKPDQPAPSKEPPAIRCAIDLATEDFNSWLSKQLTDSWVESKDDPVIQTELGILDLRIIQELGSTISLQGSLICEDGQTKELHFRADKSTLGKVVSLGSKLDP